MDCARSSGPSVFCPLKALLEVCPMLQGRCLLQSGAWLKMANGSDENFLGSVEKKGHLNWWLLVFGAFMLLSGVIISMSQPQHPEVQVLLDRCLAPEGVAAGEGLTTGPERAEYDKIIKLGADRCRAAAYQFDRIAHSDTALNFFEMLADALIALGVALTVAAILSFTIEAKNRRDLEAVLAAKTKEMSVAVMRGMFNRDHPDSLLDIVSENILSRELMRDKLSVAYVFKKWDNNGLGHPPRLKGKRFITVKATLTSAVRNVSVARTKDGKNADVPLCLVLPNPMLDELKPGVLVESVEIDGLKVPVKKITAVNKEIQTQLADDSKKQASADFGMKTLQAGQSLKVQMVYTMIKELEDSELLQTLQISKGLDVVIFDSTGWDLNLRAKAVGFGSLNEVSADVSTKRWSIDELLLPHQGILIWWKEKVPSVTQNKKRALPKGKSVAKAKATEK